MVSVAGLARLNDGDHSSRLPFAGTISAQFNYGGTVDVHLIQAVGTSAETQNRLLIYRSLGEANYGLNNTRLSCHGDFLNSADD